MTHDQQGQTRSMRRLARLMGGASIAVLAAYGPAMAQEVNIALTAAAPPPNAAFVSANILNFDTSGPSIQESRALVVATIENTTMESSTTGGTTTSSVGTVDNLLQATARGNVSELTAQTLGNTGNGTVGILTGQFADGQVRTSITGSDLTITGTGTAANSSLLASNNTIAARTTINQATTVFADDIAANLADQLAGSNQGFGAANDNPVTLTRGNFNTTLLSVDGGGVVVASTQAVAGAALTSQAVIDDSDITISLTGGANGTESSLAVEGNELRATLTGNQAATGTDLSVDTQFNSSAGVFSQQQIGAGTGTVNLNADVTNSALSVSLANATDTNLTVSENLLGAQARGNVATLNGNGLNGNGNEGTFLNVRALDISAAGTDGGVITVTSAPGSGTVRFDDGSGDSSAFGFLAATQQDVFSQAPGFIRAVNEDTALSVTSVDLLRSSVSVDDNTFFALASGNTGGTGIDLSATSITATAGLASEQNLLPTSIQALLGTDNPTDIDGGAPVALSARATGDVSDSTVTLDGNLALVAASGNTGRTSLSADADTALLSSDANARGTATISAGTFTASATDFGTVASQSITNSNILALGDSTFSVLAGDDLAAGTGNISDSTLSLSDNTQDVAASGNTLTNRIALSGNVVGEAGATFAANESVVTTLGVRQDINSAVTAFSRTALSLEQEGVGDGATVAVVDSSLLLDRTTNQARATGNVVDSQIAVTADTAIVGADILQASASSAGGSVTASAGNALASEQFRSGATTSATADTTAGIIAGDADTASGVTGSTVSISGSDTSGTIASASGNIATSGIILTAGTELTDNAALNSTQQSFSDVTAAATSDFGATPSGGIRITGIVADSSLLIEDNRTLGSAAGNIATNTISATASTIDASGGGTGNATVTLDAGVAGTADFAAANVQLQTGNVTSNLGGTATIATTIGDGGGGLDASTASVSGNIQRSDAMSNQAVNTVALDGSAGVGDASAGLASRQTSSATQTLAVSTQNLSVSIAGLFENADTDDVSVQNSSIAVDGNDNRSTAMGNVVSNEVSVTSGTDISTANVAGATAGFDRDAFVLSGGGISTLASEQLVTGGLIFAASNSIANIAAGDAGADTSILGSSLSISDNISTSTAMANDGTSVLALDAGTALGTSGSLASRQNSVANVTANASTSFGDGPSAGGIRITGDAVDSSLAIDGNAAVGSAMGNRTVNTLTATASTIDRSAANVAGSTELFFDGDDPSDDAIAAADFAVLNVQGQTGAIGTSVESFGTIALTGGLTDSSASVSGNALQGDAMSNAATNRITLDGSAGIIGTTTSLGSVQTTAATTVDSDLDGTFAVSATGLDGSTAAIDGNQGFSAATANRVTNEVSLAGNAISGQANDFGTVGVTLEPQVGAQALADTSLASVQTSFAAVSSESSLGGTIAIGADGIDASSASVSENFARAFAMGNEGVNRLGIDAATSFGGTAALTGTQVQIGNVSGISNVNAGIITAAGGTLNEGSASIDQNIAFSRVMGNDQTNALTIQGTAIDGVSGAANASSIAALGDGAVTSVFNADNIVTNFQGLRNGNVTGTATVGGTVTVAANILDSSVSASQNIAQSNVTGSRGTNLLDVNAATSVTGVSVLASEQVGRADEDETNVISSSATLNFTVDQVATTTVTGSALNVDENLGVSTAFGNDVTNTMRVSGTSVVGQQTALSSADISAAGVVSGTSDNLLGNFQSRVNFADGVNDNDPEDNAVTSAATLTVDLLGTSTSVAPANSLGTSSVSVADNFLDSTATSNRARNTLVLNADTGLSAGGALVNSQTSDSPVTSDVRLRASVGSDDFGNVAGSSIALRDNTGVARATGNDAVNVLNARGDTGITGVNGAGEATLAGGVLNAEGTFAMASNQVNTGSVTARAGFTQDMMGNPDPNSSNLLVNTGALSGSSVAIGGNVLVADAVSNRAENRLTVNGSPSSTDVTAAITSRQVATGPVEARVDSTRLASVNGAVSSSSVGLNGNTLSASAGGNVATTRLIRD